MFSDSRVEVVGFSSCAIGDTSSQDAEAQTDRRTYDDVDCQAGSSRSSEAQTDNGSRDASQAPEVDYDRLAVFLRRICPKVLAELDKAERSRAFHGHRPVEEPDDDDEAKRLHVLMTPELKTRAEVKVSSLAWSCTGRLLAIGYSCREHENWCDHGGTVHLFEVGRHDFSPTTPGHSLNTNACVTSLAAHPLEPSVLAVGTFSGEVSVWDVQSDTEVLVGSGARGHEEPVSQLCWVRSLDPAHASPLLASADHEGHLFLWQTASGPNTLHLLEGFLVTLEHAKGRSRAQASPLGGWSSTGVGITSLSFSPHEPGAFVVGLEGGGLLRCSLLLAKPSSESSLMPMKDPVLMPYEGHRGTVTCVRHSSVRQELFLSCDAAEIHVHDVNQASPLRVIHPAAETLGVEWSGSHPHLFCSWGPAGTLEYHSTSPGDLPSRPVALAAAGDRDPALVTTICFGPLLAHQQAAVGDVRGGIVMWKVPRAKDPSLTDDSPLDEK